jgi:phenylacetic acid degradation operon negative regulatory protein
MGELFGIDAAAVRVAVGRLVREGLLIQVERGRYAIGGRGAALQTRVRGWRDAEARTRQWDGGWLLVLVDHLGRTDRVRLRARERALRLSGFARSEAGFWARPENLAARLETIVAEAIELGLDPAAIAFAGAAALPLEEVKLRRLWSAETLGESYRGWIEAMAASLARLPTMTKDAAARETLLLGQAVIRAINLDPLLPAEMVDAALRRRMIADMVAYDAAGRRAWQEFTGD